MLGLILATSIIVQCTVVNFDPQPTLVCSDKTVRQISYFDWPTAWHGPELGFAYEFIPATENETAIALPSLRDERKLAEDIRRAREHQLRWMRRPTQRGN